MKKLFTLLFTVISFSSFSQNDTLNFEGGPSGIGIDSITGCWQIGKPSKTIFDTAYSPEKAIMTDTINPYPDSTNSSFDVTFYIPGFASNYYILSFKHRFDTEINKDGGYVQFYDCSSNSWLNLLDGSMAQNCMPPYGAYWYSTFVSTTLFNGEYGFTGNSGGWQTGEIMFPCMAVSPLEGGFDSIRVRFVFVSDTVSTGHEGWMIDDIVLVDPGGWCSGINENTNHSGINVFPNPTNNFITVDAKTYFEEIEIFDMTGRNILNELFTPTIKKEIDLRKIPEGIYSIKVFSENKIVYTERLIKH